MTVRELIEKLGKLDPDENIMDSEGVCLILDEIEAPESISAAAAIASAPDILRGWSPGVPDAVCKSAIADAEDAARLTERLFGAKAPESGLDTAQ